MEEKAVATSSKGRIGAQEGCKSQAGSTTKAWSVKKWENWIEQCITGKGAPAKSFTL